MSDLPHAAIPDGMPTSVEYWYARWLHACEQLDHQAAEHISGFPKIVAAAVTRAVAAERERIAREIDPDMVDLLAGWMSRNGHRWLVDGRKRLLPEDVQRWARVLRGEGDA